MSRAATRSCAATAAGFSVSAWTAMLAAVARKHVGTAYLAADDGGDASKELCLVPPTLRVISSRFSKRKQQRQRMPVALGAVDLLLHAQSQPFAIRQPASRCRRSGSADRGAQPHERQGHVFREAG
jgi:hypothetical protein